MQKENTQEEVKDTFNIPKATAKVILAGTAILLSVMQVMAFATDTVLDSLESNLTSSIRNYDQNMKAAHAYVEATNTSADSVCSAYRALKAYKEGAKYKIKDPTFNPCQSMRGFGQPETTPIQAPVQISEEETLDSTLSQ